MEHIVSSTSRDPPGEDIGDYAKCLNNNNEDPLKCHECEEGANAGAKRDCGGAIINDESRPINCASSVQECHGILNDKS